MSSSTELADQSLAHTRPPSGSDGCLSFVVHDIIIIYLRETTSEQATRGYHKKLVDRYRSQCNGDFSLVKPDGYIHQQLLYHLEMAEDHDTRLLLLGDLRWLRACLAHCAPSVVLRYYIRECIGDVSCVCIVYRGVYWRSDLCSVCDFGGRSRSM